jgi:hypothetical protein
LPSSKRLKKLSEVSQSLPSLEAIRAERQRRVEERERERVRRDAELIRNECLSLAGFVREAWRVLEPNAIAIMWAQENGRLL